MTDQITVSRALLQQAIDALSDTQTDGESPQWDIEKAAYDALRTALEQPAVEPVAWVWNPAKESWEQVHMFGHWQQGAIYAFGPEAPQAQNPLPSKVTDEMHKAACKVLFRASGLDGLPQRMLDAMRATAPQAQQPSKAVKLSDPAIDEVTKAQWGGSDKHVIYAAHRAYARAIEQAVWEKLGVIE